MNIKQLFEKATNQWLIKVLCFVVALLLYFFFQLQQTEKKVIPVNLTVVSDGLMLPVSSYPKHIKVSVRSTPQNLVQVNEGSITAILNINHYTVPGVYDVPVSIDLVPEVLLLDPLEIQVEPDSVSLTLDEKTFAYVPVTPSLSGVLPRGYELGTVNVSPTSLKVSGAQSMVSQIRSLLTDEVSLDNHTVSFEKTVNIEKVTSLVSVTGSPIVRVSVEINPLKTTREFTDVPVYYSYVPKNIVIQTPAPTVSYKVSGPQLVVEALNIGDFTVQADCSRVTHPGEYELPLLYMLPSTVTVSDKSDVSITITAEAAAADEPADQTKVTKEP